MYLSSIYVCAQLTHLFLPPPVNSLGEFRRCNLVFYSCCVIVSDAFLQPTRHKVIALKGALTVFILEKIKSLD